MKVCCVSSLESPHRGDSSEYTQYIIFSIIKKITLNFPYLQPGNCFQGTQELVETARVNEQSMFKPLKFCCIKVPLQN